MRLPCYTYKNDQEKGNRMDTKQESTKQESTDPSQSTKMSAYRRSMIQQLEKMYRKRWVEDQTITEDEAEWLRRTITELETTGEIALRIQRS